MRIRHVFLLLFTTLFLHVSGLDGICAYAGDEVDYSAPYITVENGELVTRYPAKEHAPENRIQLLLAGFLVAIAVVAIVAAVRRRRQWPKK